MPCGIFLTGADTVFSSIQASDSAFGTRSVATKETPAEFGSRDVFFAGIVVHYSKSARRRRGQRRTSCQAALTQSVGRVARLGGVVRQPDRVLTDLIAVHKAERPPRAMTTYEQRGFAGLEKALRGVRAMIGFPTQHRTHAPAYHELLKQDFQATLRPRCLRRSAPVNH